MSETNGALVAVPRKSITALMADKFNMELDTFEVMVRATCFPANPVATREEFAAGMLIANKLDLNPVTKEIHFARMKGGGIQALIGVDGWYVMANKHPAYDGCEFVDHKDAKGDKVVAITCRIFRKDRTRHTEVTEYLSECLRPSEAWKLTPTRMLRHRAFGQCARLAFSFAGVMDSDEFARWQEDGRTSTAAVKARLAELPMPPEIPAISETVPMELGMEPLPENYLDMLEAAYASVKSGDMDSLEHHLVMHEGVEAQLSPDDRAKAVKLYKDHEARITL